MCVCVCVYMLYEGCLVYCLYTLCNLQSLHPNIPNPVPTLTHTVGNAGGHALKLLITFLGNIVKTPDEPKYRSINAAGNAFKTKLATLVGPIALLKGVGFAKSIDDKYILVRYVCMCLWGWVE